MAVTLGDDRPALRRFQLRARVLYTNKPLSPVPTYRRSPSKYMAFWLTSNLPTSRSLAKLTHSPVGSSASTPPPFVPTYSVPSTSASAVTQSCEIREFDVLKVRTTRKPSNSIRPARLPTKSRE